MKTFPFIILNAIGILFLFSSCEKEDTVPAPAFEMGSEIKLKTGDGSLVASNATVVLPDNILSNTDYDYLTIGVSVDPCSIPGKKTLWVYQKLADDLLTAIDLNTYNIEWFNSNLELLSSIDILNCISSNSCYQVHVWDKKNQEFAVRTIFVN